MISFNENQYQRLLEGVNSQIIGILEYSYNIIDIKQTWNYELQLRIEDYNISLQY